MTEGREPAIKDPLPPDHRRFVLGQASLRLGLAAAAVAALALWLVFDL